MKPPMRQQAGFSLIELSLAVTILLLVFMAVIGIYTTGRTLSAAVHADSKIQNSARIAMQKLERELRQSAFGIPKEAEVGGTALWTPALFHASPTAIAFRAEIDGGNAAVICTPKSTNTNCPLTKVRIDSLPYFQALGCNAPDDPSQDLRLVVVASRKGWKGVTCSAVNTGDTSLTVTTLPNDRFAAGVSEVLTIEQVYYRYVASATPPYGTLQRYVRYHNTPDGTYPPTGVTWTTVADHLTTFTLEYQDGAGTALTGNPLSAANRVATRSVVVTLEGFDRIQPDGIDQRIRLRSQILIRNAGL